MPSRPFSHKTSSDLPPVPPISLLHPGTAVAVVLKQDQPTGHTVTGIIADLLTRGDHPRGVKVRLRDGRVGRVQRVVTLEEGEKGERLVGGAGAGLGRDGGRVGGGASAGGRVGVMRGGRVERDIREEDEYLFDEEGDRERGRGSEGLFGALEEADRRWEEERGGVGKVNDEVLVCPVCGEFEGDERAVAWHVEGHFGEGG